MYKIIKISTLSLLCATLLFSSCEKEGDNIDDLIGNYTYESTKYNSTDPPEVYRYLLAGIKVAFDNTDASPISTKKISASEFSLKCKTSSFDLSASSVKYSKSDNSFVVSKADRDKIYSRLSSLPINLVSSLTIKSITGKFDFITDKMDITITFSPKLISANIPEGSFTLTLTKE